MPTTGSGAPRAIDPATVRAWLTGQHEHKIIDVRTPAEFEAAHIPGSYNLPLDVLGEHREELCRHLEEPVVLVCRSGQRASQAQHRLAEVGMSNVHILEGGISAWEASGGPLNRGARRWDLERQVRFVAGLLVLVGILGSLLVPPLKWLSAAVGAGLVLAALTGTCAMGMLLAKLPYNRGAGACDADAIVARLTSPPAERRSA